MGAGVTAVEAGDRVAVMPLIFCGHCMPCRTGREQCCVRLGAVGMNWPWGGIAEQSIVAEHQVAVLPETVSDEAGAMVEPAAVAIQAVSVAPVRPGDIVLITGGGLIGQLVALAALAAGASDVYLSGSGAGRRERAQAVGLSASFDPTETSIPEAILDLTEEGVDVAIECAGNQAALNDCLGAVRRGGTVVQTALHTKPAPIDLRDMTHRDITLRGAICFPATGWPRVIRLIASGQMPVERIITGVTGLESAISGGYEPLPNPHGDQVKILNDATATI